jgi:RNA polymerase sigma factor (sigma-70 family)
MSSTFVEDPRDRAFERLYARYVREVYRYVLGVLRNPSEAEDVTQTTFLNAYRAIQAGADPQRPHNWLIAIAHNACRSRARFAMRRPKEVPLDAFVEQLAVPESEGLNVRELLRALGRLPFNQREALTMREFEGRSYPEIAESLGVTIPAVESLVARARSALRLQSSAFRGLIVIQLPRSLRRLLERGDAASSAIGGGAVAKVAAVLAVGVVAGSGGSTSTVQVRQTPQSPTAAPPVELRLSVVRRPAVLHRHPPARPVHVGHAAPVRATVVPRPSPVSTEAPGTAATAAPTTAASGDPSSPAPPPAVPPIVATAVASLPLPPPLPLPVPVGLAPPPAELPPLPVELPKLPDPPALPVPAPPPLPLP